MSIATDLAALFQRDLARLLQQLQACADPNVLWECPPGVTNSCGNLILHLEGNLRDFVGRTLGGVPYQRVREEEFGSKDVPVAGLLARIEEVGQLIPRVVGGLSDDQLEADFPENPFKVPMTTRQFLVHLNGHLNYHLGQIDYLRRILTSGESIHYATITR